MIKVKKRRSIKASIIRHLREWHRRLGIFAAFFLIFLSISGIALNHTNFLSLAHQPIKNTWLLEHYGIKPASKVSFYHQKQISVTDHYVWLDTKLLIESAEPVISVGKFQQFWLVASRSMLSIFTEQGELVDQLDSAMGLPNNIIGLSVEPNHLLVKTPTGYYQTDNNFFEWQRVTRLIAPKWLKPVDASDQELAVVQLQYKSQFLHWERVILDAHSGRLMGDIGVLLMDVVAIMLILLSVSGLYIWIRYARAKR